MLTERTIRDQKPGGKNQIIWDTKLKGLGCRITPAGCQAFVLRYTDARGRQRLAMLARVSEISLKNARELAARELVNVRMGGADILSRRKEQRNSLDVAQGIATFFEEYCPRRVRTGRMTPRTVQEYRKQADRYLVPALGRLAVDEVQRRHVERMVDPLRPILRNRVLALASRIFRYFEDEGTRRQHDNPCRGVERSREEPRDRTLDPTEIAALGKALSGSDINPSVRAAIQLAMLTGLRISEVISMRWECVNFEAASVLLPTTKTGRRTHPLSTAALNVLADLPIQGDHVFCTAALLPISYWAVRQAFMAVVAEAGLSDVRLQDLRRTFMTRAAESGVAAHTLRDLLGHKTATMADRYIRRANIPVVDATEAVSSAMAAMMDGPERD
ncbi:MAG: tyrosine-type recombinase/integrase [Candidatus Tectomicrobia bacterium]|nr:tyrosine-type recombinase/integrase [Candidatus Tectomicrobia bacterium]